MLMVLKCVFHIWQVFGYHLQEFEEKSGHFVLLNQVLLEESLPSQSSNETNTILFIILSAIYLSGGQIGEGNKLSPFLSSISLFCLWWRTLFSEENRVGYT